MDFNGMNFEDIKLLDENVDFSKIKPYDWDLVIGGVPYYVCQIKGYCHTLKWRGGLATRQELWCYPRNEQPSLENLVEYDLECPVAWGIQYEEKPRIKSKWGETFTIGGAKTIITRNGEPFYTVPGGMRYSVPEAITLINAIDDHPLEFNSIGYDQKMVGRKIWFNSQPAIIDHFVHGQCCVIIVPDGVDKFKAPPEFKDDDILYEEEKELKIDCLRPDRVWWFRE